MITDKSACVCSALQRMKAAENKEEEKKKKGGEWGRRVQQHEAHRGKKTHQSTDQEQSCRTEREPQQPSEGENPPANT